LRRVAFQKKNTTRFMNKTLLSSKIHRARVTGVDLDYEGSVAIDRRLMDAAGIVPFERLDIYNITNGNRFSTYAISGAAGSGEICVNGAAARLCQAGDLVIICCYSEVAPEELARHRPRVVLVDETNRVTAVHEKQPDSLSMVEADGTGIEWDVEPRQ
jgi:aspartate 1-decarboxylase